MSNTVAIIGRPNVGKSTLFNRLIGQRKSIVDDVSGVTRDRLYGVADWNGKTFNVIDTGGFVTHSEDVFESEIRKQVLIAIEEATVLLFMVDTTVGITDLEEDIAKMLRRHTKKVILVVNKVDNPQRMYAGSEFYGLGIEKIFFISSISGSGTGELLDEVASHFPPPDEDDQHQIPHIAIVGQPNVGKSSLVNVLLGEERNIVTEIAGTTRDSIHSHYKLFKKEFVLIDTAGIRKKAKVQEDLEFYSVIRAVNAIDEADVCILMIDAQSPVENQDLSILSLIEKKKEKGTRMLDLLPTLPADMRMAMKLDSKFERYKGINIPVNLMAGSKSPTYFYEGIKALASVLKYSYTKVFEGFDHYSPEEKINEIAEELNHFFGTTNS